MRFKAGLIFEFERFFCKRNLIFFFLLLLFSGYFLQSSIDGYQSFFDESKKFQKAEIEKIKSFHNYTQYGATGFRIIFFPPSISVLIESSLITQKIATVYSGFRLEFYNIHHGKQLFQNRSLKNIDFINILITFLSAFYLFFGWESLSKTGLNNFLFKNMIGVTVSRLFIIASITVFLFLLVLIGFFINGLSVDPSVLFIPFLLIFLMSIFFYSIGTASSLIKSKSMAVLLLGIVWFFLINIVPAIVNHRIEKKSEIIGSLYELECTKLKILADFEKKALIISNRYEDKSKRKEVEADLMQEALKNEFVRVENAENGILDQVKPVLKYNDFLFSFFPTGFFFNSIEEVSGKGLKSHIRYFEYVKKIKADFLPYYAENRINRNYSPVEPFLKGDRNLFFSKSILPGYFALGVLLTLFYSGVFLVASHYRRVKKRLPDEKHNIEFPPGKNAVFVLCENETIKAEITRCYEEQKTAVVLSKVNTADFRIDLQPAECVKHFCRILRVEEKRALENLKSMGIQEVKKLKTLSHETILKIYAAVKAAGDFDFLVINDFIRQESREFEKDFLKLVSSLEKAGKKIIFVSLTMYDTKGGLNDSIKIDNFRVLSLPPFREITLR